MHYINMSMYVDKTNTRPFRSFSIETHGFGDPLFMKPSYTHYWQHVHTALLKPGIRSFCPHGWKGMPNEQDVRLWRKD